VSVSSDELAFVADQVSRRTGWLDVSVQGRGALLPWSCAQVVKSQEDGGDPTAPWREALSRRTARTYGVEPPRHVAAAFVLLWYLDVLARPAAYACALGPWVLDVAPEAVRFDLSEPELFPCAVSLTADGVRTVADAGEREAMALRRYTDHAERFVAGYDAGVKMSSRQRWGAVRDTWALARRAAAQACLPPPAPAARLRESCCFIVALPGATACALCPRRAREVHAGGTGRAGGS
jgi:hypothetical protein